ncbi:hypothetical protein [Pseudochryseolinea flava]|uniref:VWA domain-containing protein n=1 Tax=Pseudochryseolinea flava TaxID=2059302 RepID=A0A364Y0V6_9BACT|nr:hypothetical protein [Pseudochryseolinea flava]RAV99736.1 hypothetical protein DQQ10_16950 [Pseudochryseolinea flava]
MHQQQVIFESSPAYIFVCIGLAVSIAFVLYRWSPSFPWNKKWNRALFALRFFLAFFLMFLLLGPIVKQINNLFEKPLAIILFDNSSSVHAVMDTTKVNDLVEKIKSSREQLEEHGFDVRIADLNNETENPRFVGTTSDLNNALRKVSMRYEGKKIENVVLISDGIYNTGISPLYGMHNFPIHTIGVGDTAQRTDISIKNVAYNKIAYEGNKFPLRIEVNTKNIPRQPIKVTLVQRGKIIDHQTKTSLDGQVITYDFQPTATEQGLQKIDIQVDVKAEESNKRNNYASAFIEVVEGKKKILLISPSPHPDIKTFRELVEKNSNYEFLVHIPGLNEQPSQNLAPDKIDLAIFHQAPDQRGRTRELFQKFMSTKTSLFIVLGQQSDLVQIGKQKTPIKFDSPPRDYDDVTPVLNAAFSNFNLSPETATIINDYPPMSVHFGRIRLAPTATSLLFQRVGSLKTEKPLLAVDIVGDRKIGVLMGEGIWRWQLNEFDRTENSTAIQEVFSKLFQFLTTTDDKRKFRSYPIQQEFSDTEPVIFESQVYNDIFEPIYGNSIKITVTNEQGQQTNYAYVTSPGNIRYEVGGLKEGVYRYKASTALSGKTEELTGEFAVISPQTELQNLTADFDLLRKLSSSTGGKFFTVGQADAALQHLQQSEAQQTIHTEEAYNNLLNLKWIFWVLLIFVSGEWFIRKYFGSY